MRHPPPSCSTPSDRGRRGHSFSMLSAPSFHMVCPVSKGLGSGLWQMWVGGRVAFMEGFFAKLCDLAPPQGLLGSHCGLTRLPLGIPTWHWRTALPRLRPCSSGKPLPESAPSPTPLEFSLPIHQANHLPAASSNCGCRPDMASYIAAPCLDFSVCEMGA